MRGAKTILLFCLVAVCIVWSASARAWGVLGHQYVHRLAIEGLPDELKPLFAANREWVVRHSIDPDNWRRNIPSEAPHHFIDLDKWGKEAAQTFPEDYWTAIGLYGKEDVDKNGVVPWRIGQYYAKLIRAFEKKDARAIVEIGTFLGHYVGDIHVPFHACLNYDGQLTGQKGLHARFESILLEKRIPFSALRVKRAGQLKYPVKNAFQWARASLALVDPILEADKLAAGPTKAYNDAYYSAFEKVARPIAIRRLEEAGRNLATLWRSAWIAAGKPELPAPTDVHAGEPLDKPTTDPDVKEPVRRTGSNPTPEP